MTTDHVVVYYGHGAEAYQGRAWAVHWRGRCMYCRHVEIRVPSRLVYDPDVKPSGRLHCEGVPHRSGDVITIEAPAWR